MPFTAKKTTQLIVERGNDYVITALGQSTQSISPATSRLQKNQPAERFTDIEKNRNRITCCIVSVFDDLSKINSEWSTVKSFVQVERIGIRQGKPLWCILWAVVRHCGVSYEVCRGQRLSAPLRE